jgi:hypothetical protein
MYLHEIMDRNNFHMLTERVQKSRKVDRNDNVTYENFNQVYKDVSYDIKPVHVPIDYIFKYGSNSCKQCSYGKGYYVVNILKNKIPNPADYIILSDQPIKDMTDEQKKIFIELEKKKPFWRVLLPCNCAMRKAQAKEPDLLMNPTGNIVLRLTYTIAS